MAAPSIVTSPGRWLSLAGLFLAFVLPVLALSAGHLGSPPAEMEGAVCLALTPWLVLAWVRLGERRPFSSIGLPPPGWSNLGYGLGGIVVNLAISAAVGAINARLGWREVPSALMSRLLAGPGWVLVTLVTSGALLTEIAFRGYALTRLQELLGGRAGTAVGVQVVVTTGLFVFSRGRAHGTIWALDDVVFSAFFLWRRDTWACVIAHAVPNFLAATLVATGVAT